MEHAHCKCMNIGKTCPNNHYADCSICNAEVGFDSSAQRFNTMLALFIEFIEEENKRVSEEMRGIFRRDGGRQMQCRIFIKNLIEYVTKEVVMDILSMKHEAHNEQEAITLDMLNDLVDLGGLPLNPPAKIRKLQFIKVYDIVRYAVKNNISLE